MLGALSRKRTRGGFVYSFVDDLVDEDGSPNWCEAPNISYGGYE